LIGGQGWAACPEVAWHPSGLVPYRRGRRHSRLVRRRPPMTVRVRGGCQLCLVSQKIFEISSIFVRSRSATAGSAEPFAPPAPASLVASLKSVWSCGYLSKCGALK
jgi:hypothetical protein